MKIDVIEIFNSISGEVSPYYQGCLTTFVRLAHCNLECKYCDTKYKMDNMFMKLAPIEFIDSIWEKYGSTGNLCLTGGEPLLQKGAVKIVLEKFRNVWIETNGTIDFTEFIGKANLVVDWKMHTDNYLPMFVELQENDFVKFVISNEADMLTAAFLQKKMQFLGCKANFAYSPLMRENEKTNLHKELFTFLETQKLPKTIINIQIHKYLEMN